MSSPHNKLPKSSEKLPLNPSEENSGLRWWAPGAEVDCRKVAACVTVTLLLLVAASATAFSLLRYTVSQLPPIASLKSVRDIRPIPQLLIDVSNNPESLLVKHHGLSLDDVTLLVIVDSLPLSYTDRMSIRTTWMTHYSKFNVVVRFAVFANDTKVLESLLEESATHKDMAIFSQATHYGYASEKLLYEFYWAERTFSYSYLMKTKDTFYVRIDELLHSISRLKLKRRENVYWGYFEGQRAPGDKGKLPEPDWFMCDKFVHFAHDGGYVLSRGLVQRFLQLSTFLELYRNEDVSVAAWAAPHSDIRWKHDVRFDTEIGRSRGCKNDYVVFPVSSGEEMVKRHAMLHSGRRVVCKRVFERVPAYQYDFSVIPSHCCRPSVPEV